MIIPMLEGISEMLKDTKEVEVKCAKIMLDKIIRGMGSDEPEVTITSWKKRDDHTQLKHNPNKDLNPLIKEPEYQISVEHGKLIFVRELVDGVWKDAQADLILEIDGNEIAYAEAIGKPFQNGRIL